MKRLIVILITLISTAGIALFFAPGMHSKYINIAVYGESNTGFSWTRTYTGEQERVDDFVLSLQESYIRLAEAMDAGSSMKIFVKGGLVSEVDHEGIGRSSFSGLQISVHDQFASRYDFNTSDDLPGQLSDMDVLIEPFVCSKGFEQE